VRSLFVIIIIMQWCTGCFVESLVLVLASCLRPCSFWTNCGEGPSVSPSGWRKEAVFGAAGGPLEMVEVDAGIDGAGCGSQSECPDASWVVSCSMSRSPTCVG
jgi:hypothetical protein